MHSNKQTWLLGKGSRLLVLATLSYWDPLSRAPCCTVGKLSFIQVSSGAVVQPWSPSFIPEICSGTNCWWRSSLVQSRKPRAQPIGTIPNQGLAHMQPGSLLTQGDAHLLGASLHQRRYPSTQARKGASSISLPKEPWGLFGISQTCCPFQAPRIFPEASARREVLESRRGWISVPGCSWRIPY